MRKPSPVGSAVTPLPTTSGRSSVVVSWLLRSWNSGRSHAAGLGTTTPTLGKLPKYESAMHTGHDFRALYVFQVLHA